MSRQAITKYLNHLADIRRVSGTNRESVVSEAFKDLLKDYARAHDLVFLSQRELPRQAGDRRIVDGALVYDLRLPFGYWEAKDEDDDLDAEIAAKFRRGYPRDNIIFEDSQNAVLIQNGNEVMRCAVTDVDALERLLAFFFDYQRPEIAEFRKAVAQFQRDLPSVLDALRAKIDEAYAANAPFRRAATKFLKHAKETINPAVSEEDVREMLIQHILTEEIFSKVFDEGDFHRQNNVARELYALEEKFFTGDVKRNTLRGLDPYYNAIRATAHQIKSHSEKQTFLKVIYEGFYKVYNPKAADRLGVVYTPQEIVRFMVESTDWLCQKHFGKALIDRDVEILDPATGTGTFICELLEHFRGQKSKLAHKYKEELHANEVAILPYYVSNLNIEASHAAIMGQYAEFPNICFVDTLDNVAGLGKFAGQTGDLFGSLSEENITRIKRQNDRKISIIIGNPPYNANQQNENDNNKNRSYTKIDERIRTTYVRESEAVRTPLYDMYVRFYRWASDRLRSEGIIAFVSNRSFIDARSFDGFRRIIAKEFSDAYIVDLGGDVRSNPKLSGTQHNVFGIQTGVAILFLIRRGDKPFSVHYMRRPELETAVDKLFYLSSHQMSEFEFAVVREPTNGQWLRASETGFSSLLPLARPAQRDRVFDLSSTGLMTGRDEWVYSSDRTELERRVAFFACTFREVKKYVDHTHLPLKIKWSRNLIRKIGRDMFGGMPREFPGQTLFRPFVSKFMPASDVLIDELGAAKVAFAGPNKVIAYLCVSSSNPLATLASDKPVDYGLLKQGNGGTQALYRYRYASDGTCLDNITAWALNKFIAEYGKNGGTRGKAARELTKDAIFHYVYAVLHDPLYREKYAQNLKREFPRIPFYPDFWRWADWGEALMKLHIDYETVEPWPLTRVEAPDAKSRAANLSPKVILRSDHAAGLIVLDSETQLTGVPAAAWSYRLGNRTALDWILDQHKEKTPKDPTIREKFNTYRFADHKEKVVDLLMRVTRVSVETMRIVTDMRAARRE